MVHELERLTSEKLLNNVREQFSKETWKKNAKLFEMTLARIETTHQAFGALQILVSEGCNPAVLLRETGLFCKMDGNGLGKEAKRLRNELDKITAQLRQDAQTLWVIVSEFMLDSYGVFKFYNDEPFNAVFGSSRELKDLAKSLTGVATFLKRHTHAKIIRNKHIVYLYYHIKAATGKPHYRQIAHMVASMPGHTETNIVKLEDALRKNIERQVERDQEFFSAAQKAIERDLSSWRYFFK